MTGIGEYLLKASLCMGLLYLVYWLFLRKETLFNTNRLYLLFSLVISVVIPLISIRYTAAIPAGGTADDLAGSFRLFGSTGSGIKNSMVLNIFKITYLVGAGIFLVRILWQFLNLSVLIRQNGIKEFHGMRVVYNQRYTMPFSFLNLIFINTDKVSKNELSDIIAHEKVHIRENHWFDLLIVEFISVILWFNPFVWFFERSIKQNHEYLADEGVIAQGYNIGRYHSVLINQLLGMEVIGITNNLNYSLNAKRLKMMKRDKTPKLRALHVIWAIPVVLLLLVAFAQPVYESSDPIPAGNDMENVVSKDVQLTVAVLDKNGDPLPGANAVIKGSKKGTTSGKDGIISMKVSDSDKIIISYVGFEDAVIDMRELVNKNGKSDKYDFKIKMKVKSGKTAVKKKADAKPNGDSPSSKEIESMKKELAVRKQELSDQYKKLEQLAKEGTVNKEKLAAKRKDLDKQVQKLKEKMAYVNSLEKK